MPSIMPTGKQQFTNNAGVPLAGGRIYTFAAGTTTPKATFQDAAGAVENPNPIVLNARGEALIFWNGAYDVKVTDANGVQVYTVGNYTSPVMPDDLSAPSGAALVGLSGGGNLAEHLKDKAPRIVGSLASLRALDKTKNTQALVTGYYKPGDRQARIFYLDSNDSTGVDNGGTLVVAADGGRWKMAHDGVVSVREFGFVPDWNGTSGTNNASRLQAMFDDVSISKITGDAGAYWFGKIPGNGHLTTVTRSLQIDWNGARLFTGETNPTEANYGTAFIRVLNAGGFHMGDYEFTDVTQDYANPSRWVMPVLIHNTGTSKTSGYSLRNFIVHKGQSLLTVSSDTPTAYAANIRFVGACHGENVYYGVNLAKSGDDFEGSYTLTEFYRALFAYDVSNVRARFQAKLGKPSSSSLLISNNGTRPTEHIDVKATYLAMNGAALISGPSSVVPTFRNLKVDLTIQGKGSNLGFENGPIRIVQTDVAGAPLGTGTLTLDYLDATVRSPMQFLCGVECLTDSPNIRVIKQDGNQRQGGVYSKGYCAHWSVDGAFTRTAIGAPASITLRLDLALLTVGPTNIRGRLVIRAEDYTNTASTLEDYDIFAFFSSTNELSGFYAARKSGTSFGGPTPTITVSTNGSAVTVSCTGLSGASGAIRAALRPF